jgi:hypothetical protein
MMFMRLPCTLPFAAVPILSVPISASPFCYRGRVPPIRLEALVKIDFSVEEPPL